MNYFAHARLAARRREDPGFVLGAMLPDWIRWIGARPLPIPATPFAEGIDFHHRSDLAFHGAPDFVALTRDAREDLLSRGLARGPSRATAHVGVELLLDGALYAAAEGATRRIYEEALASAQDADLAWSRPDAPERLTRVARRLAKEDPVPTFEDPERVAAAVIRTLEARPRLRVAATELPILVAWATRARGEVAARADALLTQTEARLTS